MSKHRVRIDRWAHGRLEVTQLEFESAESAVAAAQRAEQTISGIGAMIIQGRLTSNFQHQIKVYNDTGELTYAKAISSPTYA